MAKAIREMKEALPKVDLIIEVLDARIPYSSENPVLAALGGDKPRIKVLTKTDLADPVLTQEWLAYLESKQNTKAIALSITEPEKYRKLIPLIKRMLADKVGKSRKAIALIAGIPNVGKSTLINTLVDRAVAKTGNEPAITKGQQRIKLDDNLMLLDTPGVLWPKVENEDSAYRQGVTGAIKEAIIDNEDVAFYAAEYCLEHYPKLLLERYALDTLPSSPEEFFKSLGRERGALRAGGRVDFFKICTVFINELREGVIGRITLETPAMIEKEIVEVERIITEKAELKAANKEKSGKKRRRKR
jgi:ribosome biogenesis GTPase A